MGRSFALERGLARPPMMVGVLGPLIPKPGGDVLGRVLARDAEIDHHEQYAGQEDDARCRGAETEAAVRTRLRQLVADRRTERPRQAVRDPERADRVGALAQVVGREARASDE